MNMALHPPSGAGPSPPVLTRLDALLLNSITRNGRAAFSHINAAFMPDTPIPLHKTVEGVDSHCMAIMEGAIDWRPTSDLPRRFSRWRGYHG